jgi:DNA recombination protein RmuC
MLDKARAQTETVLKTLTDGDIRKRAMDRSLRQVEALPEAQSQALLPPDKDLDKEPDEG